MILAKKLDGLHPFEYEHLFDAKALDSLQGTPGLDTVVRQYNKHAIERLMKIQYTGSHIRVTGENFPKLYRLLDQVCDTINLPARPDLYISWDYSINGFTVGVDHPIIVLNSGAIDLLSDDELLYLIGHEIGHVKSRHALYHQMAQALPILSNILGEATLGIGKLLSMPLQLALFRWSRMSEFTADRAGLLACQDPSVAASVMMKWSGVPIRYYGDIKLKSFLEQARQFQSLDYESINKAFKILVVMNQTHPCSVMRAAELMNWIESGEYQRVVDRATSSRLHVREDGDRKSCRNCGRSLSGGEKFCTVCGAKLS